MAARRIGPLGRNRSIGLDCRTLRRGFAEGHVGLVGIDRLVTRLFGRLLRQVAIDGEGIGIHRFDRLGRQRCGGERSGASQGGKSAAKQRCDVHGPSGSARRKPAQDKRILRA